MNTLKKYNFKEISGSEMWPSSNPNDSPFNTFRCERCEWEFQFRVCGAFPLDNNDKPITFWDRAETAMRLHSESRCEYITPPEVFNEPYQV